VKPRYIHVDGFCFDGRWTDNDERCCPLSRAAPAPFEHKPWLEDLNQVREAIATKYANLDWVVVEREVDLPALFADAKARIETRLKCRRCTSCLR